MPAIKIKFSEEDHKFMSDYKEATGISIQRFVTVAIQDLRIKLEAEQYLKDTKHIHHSANSDGEAFKLNKHT